MNTLKVVNKNLIGQSEHAVLQNIDTNEIYEFSQITNSTIRDNDLSHPIITNSTIRDNDLSHPIIQSILNNGHTVQAEINNGKATLQL